ncbi:MAG: phytanoyl-CoA dioxygenase family protein, partial [bacterium]|nr:phytanoyl-CoA dioxygenase family protein [bacterium]
ETPSDLVSGTDDMGLVSQPVLKAGDLLLCVETILHGFVPGHGAPRLVAYGYASETALRNLAQADQSLAEAWASEMTPLQRAVMLPAGCPDYPPVLTSDGETCEIAETPGVFHPSIYGRDPDCGIDEKELYQWDLCGHLILRNVMDAEWLAAANEAIDQYADQIVVGGNAAKGSQALAGTGVPSFRGLFELPKPHCDSFREMVAHPAVVQRMNWMMGSGFRCRNARAICSMKGTSGHALHSGTEPVKPKNTYVFQNGRTYCDSINVAWQLRDVQEEDGGFVCIPGSHKARYPVPEDLKSCEDTMDIVRHVGMQAGDVAMFLGAAQTHGAYPWKSEVDRRAVLLGYSSRNIT